MINFEIDFSKNMHVLNFKKLTLSVNKNHMTTTVDISSEIDNNFSNDFS